MQRKDPIHQFPTRRSQFSEDRSAILVARPARDQALCLELVDDVRDAAARDDDLQRDDVSLSDREMDDETVSEDLDNGEVESGGQHAGMRRGEKPRKDPARES